VDTLATSLTFRERFIDWISSYALRARASIESPSMRVLRDGEEAHLNAVAAGAERDIREASLARTGGADITNFCDLALIVELEIPFLMECSITDWRWRWLAGLAQWNLIVDVKVLSAAGFSCSVHLSTTVLGEHFRPVEVTVVITISKVVLVVWSTFMVAINDHSAVVH
jgi:hypothetical protein